MDDNNTKHLFYQNGVGTKNFRTKYHKNIFENETFQNLPQPPQKYHLGSLSGVQKYFLKFLIDEIKGLTLVLDLCQTLYGRYTSCTCGLPLGWKWTCASAVVIWEPAININTMSLKPSINNSNSQRPFPKHLVK